MEAEECGVCIEKKKHIPNFPFFPKKEGVRCNQILTSRLFHQPLRYSNNVALCTDKPTNTKEHFPDEIAAETSTICDLSENDEESQSCEASTDK